jgi:hypothetical protein
MHNLLETHPSIRTVFYVERPNAKPERIARKDLTNIDTTRDEQFTNLVVPVILGGLTRYEDSFGEFELSGACFRRLNFFFFQLGESIFIISYDKVPIEEVIIKLKATIDSEKKRLL